ncbi:MAG: hypothetical protein ACREVJ_08355, partial [Gammaproteobacteria bacterium]
AKHLHIDFSSEDGKHRLTIRDDGIGFAAERIDTGHGLGLHSLRYRAALLGGACPRQLIRRSRVGWATPTLVL